jgi:hypothetical protein
MSNEDRRQHGLALISAYEHLPNVETRDDGAPLVQVVTDLLTDLRHAVEPEGSPLLRVDPCAGTWSPGTSASRGEAENICSV